MTRSQYLILNVLAGLFALVLTLKVTLLFEMGRTQRKLMAGQAAVVQAQRAEPLLREIALRLTQASLREPDLADLLRQYNLRVTPTRPPVPNP
jgi:hypothetical protein